VAITPRVASAHALALPHRNESTPNATVGCSSVYSTCRSQLSRWGRGTWTAPRPSTI